MKINMKYHSERPGMLQYAFWFACAVGVMLIVWDKHSRRWRRISFYHHTFS